MGDGTSNDDSGAAAAPPGYLVTGRAAHGRVGRLFQQLLDEAGAEGWTDASPYAKSSAPSSATPQSNGPVAEEGAGAPDIAFLWENAPRSETKAIRDGVRCYSHLPNGILLDDKWALARLLGRKAGAGGESGEDPDLATLESHCFRGADFETFAVRVGLLPPPEEGSERPTTASSSEGVGAANIGQKYEWEDLCSEGVGAANIGQKYEWEDLVSTPNTLDSEPPPMPNNLWVIKDAMSNGAGGIWVMDESNIRDFLEEDGCNADPDAGTPTQHALHGQMNQQQSSISSSSSILHPTHRYVAQRYAWPPTLYSGRKCHVRVYALITSDGRAYVHRRAFLHVANETFGNGGGDGNGTFESSVHITNCCANSHDPGKFAGEICADLGEAGPLSRRASGSDDQNDEDLPLGDYYPSIAASVAALAKSFEPYVRGGEANCGMEYLGLDFVLSSVEEVKHHIQRRRPVAYLLEVNAPPSQDTATGLAHAEDLHDEVISDLLRMWVMPHLGIATKRNNLGWMCVHPRDELEEACQSDESANLIVPSKAAILNRIRWAMSERRALKEEELTKSSADHQTPLTKTVPKDQSASVADEAGIDDCHQYVHCESSDTREWFDPDAFVAHVRTQFPYFAATNTRNAIFFESGGGAQVPQMVSDAVMGSLSNRDRSLVGASQQREARAALLSLLMEYGNEGRQCQENICNDHLLIMGSNATSLLDLLARKIRGSKMIMEGDEIVIASENHMANVTPWLELAESVGAHVKWWTCVDDARCHDDRCMDSCTLSELITERTKIVAMSHVSNILGKERNVTAVSHLVHQATNGRAQVVVDGVAAAPHLLTSGSIVSHVDWYVVSLHKMFGPHLGCLIGKRSSFTRLCSYDAVSDCGRPSHLTNERLCKSWEMGTMNYEACCGAVALKNYFDTVATKGLRDDECCQPSNQITSESPYDHLGGDSRSEQGSPYASDALSSAQVARICIQRVEHRLLNRLRSYLQTCAPLVRIIEDMGKMRVTCMSDVADEASVKDVALQRIPIVCFVHANISSAEIVRHCRKQGLVCRACKFLSTPRLWNELDIDDDSGMVRFSLAHYNTLEEINRCIEIVESLDGWHPDRSKACLT